MYTTSRLGAVDGRMDQLLVGAVDSACLLGGLASWVGGQSVACACVCVHIIITWLVVPNYINYRLSRLPLYWDGYCIVLILPSITVPRVSVNPAKTWQGTYILYYGIRAEQKQGRQRKETRGNRGTLGGHVWCL